MNDVKTVRESWAWLPTRIGLMGVAMLACLAFASPTQAVIVYDDSGPSRNLADPGDGSGWQFHGNYGNVTGIPISDRRYIVAKHTFNANSINNLVFNSGANAGAYTPIDYHIDANSDLVIVDVAETFSEWAPLYTKTDEYINQTGKDLTVFGRGRVAGSPVTVSNELKGWQWGAYDGQLSWGRNTISGTYESGTLLGFAFDAMDDADEAGLAVFDSGGGVFLLDTDDNTWKLAGINYAVDGPFRYTQNGGAFDATLFDKGGLWEGDNNPTFINDQGQDIPSNAYATRLSVRMDWIDGVLATPVIPEPGTLILLAPAAMALLRRRRAR